ncbi:hypothetical protein [Ilyobacter sp.]|uniref:hypothetical protein n=1 Tax=Ilyobacter sp. TaxID=3100343 RepID=UPI0035637612
MKSIMRKTRVVLSALGGLIFIISILLVRNFEGVDTHKNYAKIASSWSSMGKELNHNNYAKVAANWTGNERELNHNSYVKIAANWTSKGEKITNNSYAEIASNWIHI